MTANAQFARAPALRSSRRKKSKCPTWTRWSPCRDVILRPEKDVPIASTREGERRIQKRKRLFPSPALGERCHRSLAQGTPIEACYSPELQLSWQVWIRVFAGSGTMVRGRCNCLLVACLVAVLGSCLGSVAQAQNPGQGDYVACPRTRLHQPGEVPWTLSGRPQVSWPRRNVHLPQWAWALSEAKRSSRASFP